MVKIELKSGKTFHVKAKGRKARRRGGRKNISVARFTQRTIPDKLLVKLPYTDLEGINGTGPTVQKAYNINGLYDPETGQINQQNLGFKQYMSLFSKYRVYKVDYDVTLINTSQTAVAGSISFAAQGNQVNMTDIQQLQQPYSKRFTLGLGGASTTSSAQSMKRIKGSIFLPRVLGLTSEQFRVSDSFWGTVGINPIRVLQMSINGQSINASLSPTIQCDVRYTCYVELFDRVGIFGSDAPAETQE